MLQTSIKKMFHDLQMFMNRNIYKIVSFLVHTLSIACIVATIKIYKFGFPNDVTEMQAQILLSFILSICASYFFFFYTIFYPDRIRTRIIKGNFTRHLTDFKESVIECLLRTLQLECGTKQVEELMAPSKFKDFFKINHLENQTRWDLILDKLDSNELFKQEILFQLDILKEESSYVLSTISIHNSWTYSFLKQLNFVISAIKRESIDDNERLASFLWGLFSGWSYVEGYSEADIMEKLKNNL